MISPKETCTMRSSDLPGDGMMILLRTNEYVDCCSNQVGGLCLRSMSVLKDAF